MTEPTELETLIKQAVAEALEPLRRDIAEIRALSSPERQKARQESLEAFAEVWAWVHQPGAVRPGPHGWH